MELLSCIENHKGRVFFPLCSFICVQLHLSFSLYLHPLFICPGSLQYKFLCELMWTVSDSCGPFFLLRNTWQCSPYFKLMRSEQCESTRVYDNRQVLEEYINIKCIVLKGQQSWVLSTLTALPSHLHEHSVKEQDALSLSVSLYLPLTHKYTPSFCT